uniref:Uncharacterized protein n=1 Tax=viral metagenome TaxID=1070528 RepID=A0A6C0ECF9_9ZZZZ
MDGFIDFEFTTNNDFLYHYYNSMILTEPTYIEEYKGKNKPKKLNSNIDILQNAEFIKEHMRERKYLQLFYGNKYFIGFADFINFLYNSKTTASKEFFKLFISIYNMYFKFNN